MQATRLAPTLSEPLPWPEICERYPDEWVSLVEIERVGPADPDVCTARVVGHGKTRLAPLDMARPWWNRYPRMGHRHTNPRRAGCGREMTERDHRALEEAIGRYIEASRDVVPTISEPLTWTAICERYPEEWVSIVEMDRVDVRNFEFRAARVVGHGKTRGAPLMQSRPWWLYYDEIAHYSTALPLPVGERSEEYVRVDLPGGPPRFYSRSITAGAIARSKTQTGKSENEVRSAEGRILVSSVAAPAS